jgi:hypothetical protein
MAGVFQNIDPPPLPPGECASPAFGAGGEYTFAGWRGGWGVNILEDARHSSVLYVCKYFVAGTNGHIFPKIYIQRAVTLHGGNFITGCVVIAMTPAVNLPPLSMTMTQWSTVTNTVILSNPTLNISYKKSFFSVAASL